ncbi:MAG: circularly permuted type 2 ATP-grasp protein [Acidimicrobiales bacterium]|nr:circularly permuted type 2 ATP-grasp protein [Acidimicrobiales bacterium]
MRGLFDGYEPTGAFDEMFDAGGGARPHYRRLAGLLEELGADELRRRDTLRDATFRTKGITFAVYGDEAGTERTFPVDLLPRLIPADEWAHVEAGLAQRVRTLNLFLDDLYAGEQAAVRDGIVPRDVVVSSDGFVREAMGITVPHGARCVVSGIDLVRDDQGTYRVLEDNVRNPSGISYVLENRSLMTRVFPRVFQAHRVRSVEHYGASLRRALVALSPTSTAPTVAVLTPGSYNSAYFEHVFAARQMGVPLVDGRDLVVEDHAVHLRTTDGLARVDVLYRRLDDRFLDPVGFRSDSVIGVPGLLSAIRAGNVSVANAIGNGVADDKLVYAYVPDLIRYYLAEEPILPNVDTYRLADPDHRSAVLDRLDEVVCKPVAGAGGYGVVIGPTATDRELDDLRAEILADPRNWIAQEVVTLSRHPTLVDDGRIRPRHVDLRPFVLTTGDGIEVVAGGLTRVALREGSLIVNSSQGGGSKDTWVLLPEGPDEVAP